jgi:hypothetical protein
MGLGLPHLYTIQEISRLKDIISHTYNSTTTGFLFQTSLELLLLEVGMGTDLHNINIDLASPLATASLVKSYWLFLNNNNLCLHLCLLHNILLPYQCLDDKQLMSECLAAGASKTELLSLNRCRLHLKAYFLSDITDGYGTMIAADAWTGRYQALPCHTSWPNHALPLHHDWVVWR